MTTGIAALIVLFVAGVLFFVAWVFVCLAINIGAELLDFFVVGIGTIFIEAYRAVREVVRFLGRLVG